MRTLMFLALAACATSDGAPKQAAPTASAPPLALYAATEPAPTGAALRVFVEPTRLVGWIAGRGLPGVVATIELAGRDYSVPIDADGTFVLTGLAASKPTEATVRAGALVQHVMIEPAVAPEPTAYFLVDRPAVRPGGKLAFAAFLRKLDAAGYVPIANAHVAVRIESETKHVLAAKLDLVADAGGRIAGDYTFSPADILDGYTLSIEGYRGDGHVTLAEFKKPKVKLDVDAKVATTAADLSFHATDFMDQPVPGGEVGFTVQIVRDAPAGDGLRPESRLQLLADPDAAGRSWSAGAQVVGEVRGKVALDAKGAGTYHLPIASDVGRGRHRLLVDAVIVDANGREQRTTRTIPLGRTDVRVQLATTAELVAAGNPVELAVHVVDASGRPVAATASVAALRVEAPAQLWYGGGYYGNGYYGNAVIGNSFYGNGLNNNYVSPNGGVRLGGYWTDGGMPWRRRWLRGRAVAARVGDNDRLAATVPVIGDAARLVLADAGAYRLVANAQLPDGSSVWSELDIAVRERDLLPPLVLALDRADVRRGERITGRLDSRYRDAAVLVVVRDARGIVARHRVTLANGSGRFDVPAGDSVEAYMLGANQDVYATQAHVRVVPDPLAVRATTVKTTYGPGELVDLDVASDPDVDLVVSVFDRSLLGVAPDRSPDPARFYTDPRVRQRAALATLRAELGDVTVKDVVARARTEAKRVIAADDAIAQQEHAEAVQLVALFDNAGYVNAVSIVALLRYAGARATSTMWSSIGDTPVGDRTAFQARRVIDVVEAMPGLAFERVADTFVISNPLERPQDAAQVMVGGGAMGNASYSAPVAAPIASLVALQVDNTTGDVVRRDFSDSALWSGTAHTDAGGKTRLTFKLPDSLTTWQVAVTAMSRDTRVGRTTASVRTVRDVMVYPMLPRQFTEGDTVSISGAVHNLTDSDRDIVVTLKAAGVDVLSPATVTVRVPRGLTVPVVWSVHPREPGMADLTMTAVTASGADASEKHIPIGASVAEQVVTASGFADHPLALDVPAGVDPAQAKLELTFAPSLAADMLTTLDYLVEYPYGCAEQTMSRFAPAIKVAGILDNFGIAHGPLAKRLPGVIDGGMRRLVELQQPDGGWGWQGTSPTHDTITSYVVWGLLAADKAGYKLADDRVLKRGLERVHAIAATAEALSDRTYAMYVYAQREPLPDAWWKQLAGRRDELSDYALALALELAVARDDTANADRMAKMLHERAHRDGGVHWTTARFTRWQDEPYETTAAVLHALVAHDADDALVPDVLAYFAATKRGDRWNSTKDTAMILYAMSDLLAKKGVKAGGKGSVVDYTIDDRPKAHVAFADGLARTVVADKLAHHTKVAFSNASPGMLVHAVLRYRKRGRDIAPMAQGLSVVRQLYQLGAKGVRVRELVPGDRVPKGAYIESAVTVTHAQGQMMPFLLVEDPKPTGGETLPLDDPRFARLPVTWTLREDRESHLAFHHESAGSTTTTRTFLHLETSGDLVIAPAQAELMYQTTVRGHSGSFTLRVD